MTACISIAAVGPASLKKKPRRWSDGWFLDIINQPEKVAYEMPGDLAQRSLLSLVRIEADLRIPDHTDGSHLQCPRVLIGSTPRAGVGWVARCGAAEVTAYTT